MLATYINNTKKVLEPLNTHIDSKKIADDLINWLREYAGSHIDSHIIDEQSSFLPHVFLDLGNQGFFGMHVSRQYQGLQLSISDILRVIEQVAAIDLSVTLVLIEAIQNAHTLEKYATEPIKLEYLDKLA